MTRGSTRAECPRCPGKGEVLLITMVTLGGQLQVQLQTDLERSGQGSHLRNGASGQHGKSATEPSARPGHQGSPEPGTRVPEDTHTDSRYYVL